MKVSKYYIAADDDMGAYVYSDMPTLREDKHSWFCHDGDCLVFISASHLEAMGYDIEDLMVSPHEFIVIY